MSEGESNTTDLVELTRRSFAAANRRDWNAVMAFFAPDAVWEAREFQSFEGREAIRSLLEDWLGAYDNVEIGIDKALDLGSGVGFVTVALEGRLAGSTAHIRVRYGAVYRWADNLIVRITSDSDIDEARAAAERLVEEIG